MLLQAGAIGATRSPGFGVVVVACDDGSVQTGECGVARVRCVLTECAEPLLLQAWLRHHAHLFGLENLTVFDSSTDAATAKLLLGAQRAGVDVRRGQGSETGCEQAKIVMKSWRADEAALDFAIPLTCEEFLAVYTADGVSWFAGARATRRSGRCGLGASGRGCASCAVQGRSLLPCQRGRRIEPVAAFSALCGPRRQRGAST